MFVTYVRAYDRQIVEYRDHLGLLASVHLRVQGERLAELLLGLGETLQFDQQLRVAVLREAVQLLQIGAYFAGVIAQLLQLQLDLVQHPFEADLGGGQVALQRFHVCDFRAHVKHLEGLWWIECYPSKSYGSFVSSNESFSITHLDVVIFVALLQQPLHYGHKQTFRLRELAHLHRQIGHHIEHVRDALLVLLVLGHAQRQMQHLFGLVVLLPLHAQNRSLQAHD